jgi:hypothetical protein
MNEIEALLAKYGAGPVLFAAIAIYLLLDRPRGGPCRRCKHERCVCPPLSSRMAGPWRGPGSFGKAPFGPQVGHRR